LRAATRPRPRPGRSATRRISPAAAVVGVCGAFSMTAAAGEVLRGARDKTGVL
jgi:hypothetical protein